MSNIKPWVGRWIWTPYSAVLKRWTEHTPTQRNSADPLESSDTTLSWAILTFTTFECVLHTSKRICTSMHFCISTHLTVHHIVWKSGPCYGVWGKCCCQEGIQHWRGEEWAHTAMSGSCQQGARSRHHRWMSACVLCNEGPVRRNWKMLFKKSI